LDFNEQMQAIDADMVKVGRPAPPMRFFLQPPQMAQWRATVLAEWQAANPEAEARFQALKVQYEKAESAAEKEALARARSAQAFTRLAAIGVGKRTIEVVRNPSHTAPLRDARDWWKSESWALVLLGGPGTGKSAAAAWCAHAALCERYSVEWIRAIAVCRESMFGPEADDFDRRCRTTGLLVLDDVGADFATDGWRVRLADIIDARWAEGFRTIISSNLQPDEFRERMGHRTCDRLADGGRMKLDGGASMRRSK
jgi:DNA replication protein DnaC